MFGFMSEQVIDGLEFPTFFLNCIAQRCRGEYQRRLKLIAHELPRAHGKNSSRKEHGRKRRCLDLVDRLLSGTKSGGKKVKFLERFSASFFKMNA
jgi:hypothetical protein